MKRLIYISLALIAVACAPKAPQAPASDPLSSWNDTPAKKAILTFVAQATDSLNAKFIPVPERIAVFDNDGTLWCEQPLYNEMIFSLQTAAATPGSKQVSLKENPEEAILKAFVGSHSGMSSEAFADKTDRWLDTAKHPRFGVYYRDLTYLPMVELLSYLRANDFKTYIVSGGSSAFMRRFTEESYGIPPEQVIGTMLKAQFANLGDSAYAVNYTPELWHMDDAGGKPVAIEQLIGRKPVLAFGNSDGDLQMLQWTSTNPLGSLCLILHHTDAEREYAYDSLSSIGKLKNALTQAQAKNWTVVDMKSDFRTVFSFQAD